MKIGLTSKEEEFLDYCLLQDAYLFGSFVTHQINPSVNFNDIDLAINFAYIDKVFRKARELGFLLVDDRQNVFVYFTEAKKEVQLTNKKIIPNALQDFTIDVLMLALDKNGFTVKPLGYHSAKFDVEKKLELSVLFEQVKQKQFRLLEYDITEQDKLKNEANGNLKKKIDKFLRSGWTQIE